MRAPLLLQELLEADASVICLQECNRFGASVPDCLLSKHSLQAADRTQAAVSGKLVCKGVDSNLLVRTICVHKEHADLAMSTACCKRRRLL